MPVEQPLAQGSTNLSCRGPGGVVGMVGGVAVVLTAQLCCTAKWV